MLKKDYSELLKDWRWSVKSSEIKRRDENKCRSCGKTEHLEVHHIVYTQNVLPWDYEDNDLVTLCRNCHSDITKLIDNSVEILRRISCDPESAEQLRFLLFQLYGVSAWRIRDYAKLIRNLNAENDFQDPKRNIINAKEIS